MTFPQATAEAAELEAISVREITEGRRTLGPFPYQDCRSLAKRLADPRLADVAPDLNVFFREIHAVCGWGPRILTWTQDRIAVALHWLSMPFDERFPQYREFQALISETDTPDLWKHMQFYEGLRVRVVRLLQYAAERAECRPEGDANPGSHEGKT